MSENNENKNQFDLEWQELRNEYQSMMSDDSDDGDIYKNKEDNTEYEENSVDFSFSTKPYEDDDSSNDYQSEEDFEEQIARTKKDIATYNEEKKSIDIGSIAKNGFGKMVNMTNGVLTKVTQKSAKTCDWSEEQRADLSRVIVIIFCVVALFLAVLLLIKIPSFVGNVFEFIESHDKIEGEGMVYIDEKTRTYHFEDCPHLEKDMRYLTLEEAFASELGYQECDYIKNGK